MNTPVINRDQVEWLGRLLLGGHPNVIVRHRILRDVLRLPVGSAEMESARRQMISHPWVKELAYRQRADGTWGRFHSMDSTIKARFPTCETAIRRALALGLDINTPVLHRAIEFMEKVLAGKAAWSDRVEKSENWPIGVEAITAGTLAQVDPSNPAIRQAWEYWAEIAERSFPEGAYYPSAEWQAHKAKRGVGIHYLGSRYVLTLLGARSADLSPSLDRRLVGWIWNNPLGIGYLGADLKHPLSFHIFNWLESLEILAGFQSWRSVAVNVIKWLWEQRKTTGLWDFGQEVGKSCYFPLSDDWRKAGNRALDHSTRVSALLKKYSDN
jgi:hypothetical protein